MMAVQPTYTSVHYHLEKLRGKARDHVCRCGAPALDWAYLYNDEDALVCPTLGRMFSTDIENSYAALCRKCHRRLDQVEEPRIFENVSEAARRTMTGTPKAPGHLDKIWETRHRKLEEDPEYAAEYSSRYAGTMRRTNSTRYRCLACGYENNAGNLGVHFRKSGHVGREKINA